LPIGAEVQVLQSCVLQADVLQDVPRTLTLRRSRDRCCNRKLAERKADQCWRSQHWAWRRKPLSLAHQHTHNCF